MATAADLVFLQDMALVMVVAAVTTVLFHRLHQPVVLGYLLAGFLIGSQFNLVRDQRTIEVLGDLGIVFLLFALGIEFNFRKLRRVGATALVAGVLETSLMVWLGYSVGRAFGLDHVEAVFLGAIISISSTTLIVKVLTEFGQRDEEWSDVIFGILVVEDVLAVLILTLLSTAGGSGGFSAAAIAPVVAKLGVFVGAALVLGLVVVPRVVGYVARFPVGEVLIVTVLGLAFGMALLASYLGLSTALGAFIMGALISESRAAQQVEAKIAPIRDLFTAIFFVAVGMLIVPGDVLAHLPLILAVTAAVVVGKVVAVSFATFVTGHEPATALRVGFGLAQIGEFSFIIAALALASGVTGVPLDAVAVSVSALTAFATPFLFRSAPRAVRWFEGHAPRPLRTYASLYGAWIRRLRELSTADPSRRRAVQAGVRTGLYGASLVAITAIGAASVPRVQAVAGSLVPALGATAGVTGWTAVGLAIVPFAFLFWRSLHVFVTALAEAALPDRLRASANGANVQLVLRRTFFLAGVVLTASLLLVLTAPFVPAGPLLAVVGVAVAGSAILLYGSLVRFHRRVDATLAEVLDEAASGAREERGEILSLIRESYPWDVEAKEVKVPLGVACVNRSIRDLRLRSATGATVVGVRRGRRNFTNPAPETVIQAGDVLVLMGEDAQVDAARRIVLRPTAAGVPGSEDATWREVVVSADSALVGRTLAGARLRERTGATVIGVVRAGDRIPNPGADLRLQSGDVLLVVGSPGQMERAEAIARPRSVAGEEEELPS